MDRCELVNDTDLYSAASSTFFKGLPCITLNKFPLNFFSVLFINEISIYSCGLELVPFEQGVNGKSKGKLQAFIHIFTSAL
jgi:hypothetical protein